MQGVIWVNPWRFQGLSVPDLQIPCRRGMWVFVERPPPFPPLSPSLLCSFPQGTDAAIWWPLCLDSPLITLDAIPGCRPRGSPNCLPFPLCAVTRPLLGQVRCRRGLPGSRGLESHLPPKPRMRWQLLVKGSHLIRCPPMRSPSHPSVSVTRGRKIPPHRAGGAGGAGSRCRRRIGTECRVSHALHTARSPGTQSRLGRPLLSKPDQNC